ncbi:MAG: RsmB/NOP family class I SAM-dependent RNA methyltransferase [Chlamydiales bacterium]|nr:RsmB/NOP family class I SAM-dependent RNA methyltransferase [Chlamydiia bacterium]MCP5506917.1 RsmB/NOP family class I SAM-dependent RNA methyltransferase [Chlamydiales bacterium]
MDKTPFREHHLLILLEEYDNQSLPLDYLINRYFRAHHALGSKDRAYIAETAYTLVRWRGLLDYLSCKDAKWEQRLRAYETLDISKYLEDETIPLHIRYSFPKELFDSILDSMGVEDAKAFCYASNFPAPTTIRANTLKISREELLQQLSDRYPLELCSYAEAGLRFLKKENFFLLPEFKSGFFEVQDEGSQLLAALVAAKPGQLVMDYCSGSGGKALAIAPLMQNRGQLYLHDVRKHALFEARKRLRRAGIQNAQIIEAESSKLKRLKQSMDWVLVDAPCSGTGTLRRNPDMKWKIDKATIARLRGLQRTIFEKALSFLKRDGKIVYGTCSVLKEENQDQLSHFMETYGLELVTKPLSTRPAIGGMDGFFGAVMRRRCSTKAK